MDDAAEGCHGGTGYTTEIIPDVIMLGVWVVLSLSWMPNMVKVIAIVVKLKARYTVLIVYYKGITISTCK